MSIDIVHLLESVEIEKEDSMRGSGAGRRGNGRIQRFIKLPPVCKAGQGILEGKFAYMLFGGHAPASLLFLLLIASRCKNQQSNAKYPTQAQRLVQFDGLLPYGHGILVFIDIEFERQKRRHQHDDQNHREILQSKAVAHDEAPKSGQMCGLPCRHRGWMVQVVSGEPL